MATFTVTLRGDRTHKIDAEIVAGSDNLLVLKKRGPIPGASDSRSDDSYQTVACYPADMIVSVIRDDVMQGEVEQKWAVARG
jgi:hypothetical protein